MREIGGIAEVLGLIGVIGAFVVGLVWLVTRASRGRWVSAPAEIVDGELRWMTPNGTVHRWTLDKSEAASDDATPRPEELEIHYRSFRPGVPYFEAVAHDEKALRLVTLLLLGIGVVAFVASTILGWIG